MAREVIHIKSMDLLCDACGYFEPKQELSEKLIGKRCPECGADMLTRQDFESAVKLKRFSDLVNALLGPIFGSEKAKGGESVSVNPHGDTLTIRKGHKAAKQPDTGGTE